MHFDYRVNGGSQITLVLARLTTFCWHQSPLAELVIISRSTTFVLANNTHIALSNNWVCRQLNNNTTMYFPYTTTASTFSCLSPATSYDHTFKNNMLHTVNVIICQ